MPHLKSLALVILGLIVLIAISILASIPAARMERPKDLLVVDNTSPLLLRGLNVVDVLNGGVVGDQDILIRHGRIERISDEILPGTSGANILELPGAYISPGLFDMHVHLHDRKYLARNLAFGITSVRNLRGLPMHIRWRHELERGEWLGSRIWTSSPVLDGEEHAHLLQEVISTPEQARAHVNLYKELGYDSIKAYGYLEPEVFQAVVDEARALGFPVVKHGPNAIEGSDLLANAGLQSLEHVEDIFQGPLQFTFDKAKLNEWLLQLKALDPYVTPTLATFEHLTLLSRHKDQFVDSLELETLNPVYRMLLGEFSVKRWLAADQGQIEWNEKELLFLQEIALAMDNLGIQLLVGSDAGTMYMPAGSSTHREIQLLGAAGLPSISVLRAGTINAATALNVAADYGSVTEGKIADAIITYANPLDDLSVLQHPDAVIKAGQWLSRDELDALMKSAQNPSAAYFALGRLLEDLITRAFVHPVQIRYF